ncbi:MAG: aminodeoxychorismate/anthranilate synthase component II [Candidatus Cloacimonetes bacterium]|nr:aminodeoxychorismate/anthranilate synthase component II [Candidatus Cloacimonadota bacterium]
MKKIILIDNFDSFTYNLKQILGFYFDGFVEVRRNNEIDILYIQKNNFSGIVISPGPGKPNDVPFSKEIISKFYQVKPILGICLGMQCLNETFGGITIKADYPVHGKTSKISHSKTGIFNDIPQNIEVARYHSLIIDNLPSSLEITAKNESGIIMGIQHKKYPLFGLQFHPESFLTQFGKEIILNFLKFVK